MAENERDNGNAVLMILSVIGAGFLWWLVGASGDSDDGPLGFVGFVVLAVALFLALRWALSRRD